MKYVNLTPHAISFRRPDGSTETFPPSGTVARVASTPGAPRWTDPDFSPGGMASQGEE
jgi:hypothetical protein